MHKKYGRKENIRKQNAVIDEKGKQKKVAYYSLAFLIILNSLFLIFFTWMFFEKELHIHLIPFVLAIVNTVLIKYIINGFSENSKVGFYVIISFCSCFFLFTVIKDQIRDKELHHYGKNTNALIYQKKWHASSKGPDYWIVSAKFEVNNNLYTTFFVKDKDEKFQVGDSTKIIFSIRNPEISKLIYLEK